MSRMRAKSEAYARSEDSSSNSACVRFDTGAAPGEGSGGGPSRRGIISTLLSSSPSASALSAWGDGGGIGRGFSGVLDRMRERESKRPESVPRLRECIKVISATLSSEMEDRASAGRAFALGRRGERGGSGGEAGGDAGGDGGKATVLSLAI